MRGLISGQNEHKDSFFLKNSFLTKLGCGLVKENSLLTLNDGGWRMRSHLYKQGCKYFVGLASKNKVLRVDSRQEMHSLKELWRIKGL